MSQTVIDLSSRPKPAPRRVKKKAKAAPKRRGPMTLRQIQDEVKRVEKARADAVMKEVEARAIVTSMTDNTLYRPQAEWDRLEKAHMDLHNAQWRVKACDKALRELAKKEGPARRRLKR